MKILLNVGSQTVDFELVISQHHIFDISNLELVNFIQFIRNINSYDLSALYGGKDKSNSEPNHIRLRITHFDAIRDSLFPYLELMGTQVDLLDLRGGRGDMISLACNNMQLIVTILEAICYTFLGHKEPKERGET